MINPSKTADAQGDCILFKLTAETRKQIYDLVYAAETDKDGAVELNEATLPPYKDLLLTCQQVYNESRKVYKAAYRDYPVKLTIDIANRESLPFIPALDNKLLRRMESLVVTWRADEHNKGKPLRFTSEFNFEKWLGGVPGVSVDMNDKYWRGPQDADSVCYSYRGLGRTWMNKFYWSHLHPSSDMEDIRDGLAHAISVAVYAPKEDEAFIWDPEYESDSGDSEVNSSPAATAKMMIPSKPANTQDDCPLFKLAAETRNAIYALVFATETQEDGSVKLDDIPADNALTRTCQQIHIESHKMHKLASHNYPSHTFTLDVPDRKEGLSVPRLSNTFFPANDLVPRHLASRRAEQRQTSPLHLALPQLEP
jgi:hypothetical protein